MEYTEQEQMEHDETYPYLVFCDGCNLSSESGWGDTPYCLDCEDDRFICSYHNRTHYGVCPLCEDSE